MRPSALAVAALVAVLLPASAQASNPNVDLGGVTDWSPYFVQLQTGMDTPEPPDGHFATNTTGCAWNDEDQILDNAGGDLTGTTSDTICIVADLAGGTATYPKLLIGRIYVQQTARLAVWLTNDQGGYWQAGGPIPYGSQAIYQLCVADPVAITGGVFSWQDLAYWPLVPGTTGYGQIVNYTLHVESLRRTAHKVNAWFEAAFNDFYGSSFRPVIQTTPPGEVPCPGGPG